MGEGWGTDAPMLAAANWEKIHAVGGVMLRAGERRCESWATSRLVMSYERSATHPATLVKYARKAVPDNMTGSYQYAMLAFNGHMRRTAETVHVSNYDARHKEEHVKVREQLAARRPALPRDPKRQKPQQPRRIQRNGDIRLQKSANQNQQQARLESAYV